MELKEMIGMEGVQRITVGLGEELLDNLLLPYVNTQHGKTAPHAGAGARVSPAVLSSNCSSMTAIL